MMHRVCTIILVIGFAATAYAQPLTTSFTYQGELCPSGSSASGLYDLRFRFDDAASAGAQVGSTLCADNVSPTNGRFTIDQDFGGQFSGQHWFLEIDVRTETGLA